MSELDILQQINDGLKIIVLMLGLGITGVVFLLGMIVDRLKK